MQDYDVCLVSNNPLAGIVDGSDLATCPYAGTIGRCVLFGVRAAGTLMAMSLDRFLLCVLKNVVSNLAFGITPAR